MKTYSLCFPEKWRMERNPATGGFSACNKAAGSCTAAGGVPLPDSVSMTFEPAAPGSSGKLPADLSEAITQADPHVASKENPSELASGALTGQTEYVVSRCQLPNKVWNDVFAIESGGRIFIARVRYRDEPAKVDGYRNAVFAILGSVSVRKDGPR